uniref:Uncharacterized protein n=1 Tax=Romanomermis culicivorax TaxID=13658 RepID=A0A915I6V2_ROMCU
MAPEPIPPQGTPADSLTVKFLYKDKGTTEDKTTIFMLSKYKNSQHVSLKEENFIKDQFGSNMTI